MSLRMPFACLDQVGLFLMFLMGNFDFVSVGFDWL